MKAKKETRGRKKILSAHIYVGLTKEQLAWVKAKATGGRSITDVVRELIETARK